MTMTPLKERMMPSQRRQCTCSFRKTIDMIVAKGTPSWLVTATTEAVDSERPTKNNPKPTGPAHSAMMMTCFIRPR